MFSSLFPAHLYLKGIAAGHEIEHNEELHDQEINVQGTLLQDRSSVFIGSETTQDSYSRVPVNAFGKKVMSMFGWQEGQSVGKTQIGNPMV